MDNELRKNNHKKNTNLESIFPQLENAIGGAELTVLEPFSAPQKKVYFIVGCARSGSTLLYQYLSKTNYFVYPTNFLSRFYYAPYLGYKLQQVLIDFDDKGEVFNNINEQVDTFKSNLGKTQGPKEAHEFWYFWNRFFKFKNIQKLSKKEIQNVDWCMFLKELHALETAANKPILMKAMNLNWNLLELAKRIPNIHFIYIKRDVLYNAQSLLHSRNKFFGNMDTWYSYKPPNYKEIKTLPIEQQVVEQVMANNSSIENQLSQINSKNKTTLEYAQFCKTPFNCIEKINKKIDIPSTLRKSFKNTNTQNLPNYLFNAIKRYIKSKAY